MATLKGKDLFLGFRGITFAPIPAEQGDATEYRVEVHFDATESWHRQFSIADWFLGPDEIWMVARAFIDSPMLLETKVPFHVWPGKRWDWPAELSVYAGWFDFHIFSSQTKRQKKICATFFFQEASDPTVYHRFFIRASPEDAIDFGQQLQAEIINASPNWAAERTSEGIRLT